MAVFSRFGRNGVAHIDVTNAKGSSSSPVSSASSPARALRWNRTTARRAESPMRAVAILTARRMQSVSYTHLTLPTKGCV